MKDAEKNPDNLEKSNKKFENDINVTDNEDSGNFGNY